MSRKKSRKKIPPTASRKRARLLGSLALLFVALWAWAGVWFVHQYPTPDYPALIAAPLEWIGNPVGDLTDALGLTGFDIIHEYDTEAPIGEVAFAGLPQRIGEPAPKDIQVLSRGEYFVGWSPSLRHPVWVAYHVPAKARHTVPPRPNFMKDTAAANSPRAGDYKHSGYDRGHMAPNHAIASRFGEKVQKNTFQMSNIAPQTPALNRGVWREVEHRIADLWTARYGEIWVIVGCIPSSTGKHFGEPAVDVPDKFYQIIVAQEGVDVRAMALLFDQEISWDVWPTRALVTIDELEEATGFNFLCELPDFLQRPLESGRPSRLWPIRPIDAIKKIFLRFSEN